MLAVIMEGIIPVLKISKITVRYRGVVTLSHVLSITLGKARWCFAFISWKVRRSVDPAFLSMGITRKGTPRRVASSLIVVPEIRSEAMGQQLSLLPSDKPGDEVTAEPMGFEDANPNLIFDPDGSVIDALTGEVVGHVTDPV